MPSRRLKRRNSEDFFCTKERLHNMLSNYSWPRKGRNKSASSIWRAFWPHIGHERVRNQPHNELEKVFIFKNALRWLGHPKYLLIFNYGIGIKTGIHFQLRNWLRNWEFGPKAYGGSSKLSLVTVVRQFFCRTTSKFKLSWNIDFFRQNATAGNRTSDLPGEDWHPPPFCHRVGYLPWLKIPD